MVQLQEIHKLGQSTMYPPSSTGAYNVVAPSAPIHLVQLSTTYQAGVETTYHDLDAHIQKTARMAPSDPRTSSFFPSDMEEILSNV